MRKKCLIVLIMLLVLTMLTSSVYALHMSIMTGSTKGTYYQFGLNLAQLVKSSGIDLIVVPSKGSIENIYAVFQRPRTQLGIVQADALAFVARVGSDPVLKKIAKKIKMVFPLYNEEVHLVGRKGLTGFADLSGKQVAIGKAGSGTYLTARLLFELSGIKPARMLTIGTDDALAQLKSGKIDAMFYVAGVPVKLFSNDVHEEDQLSLLPIVNQHITDFYPKTVVPAGTYAWQPASVSTVAVKAVLISFDFRNYHCANVGRVGALIYKNLDWLKKNGHSKWNSVDLDFRLKGWEQYDCVKNMLPGNQPGSVRNPASKNPIFKAIQEILK